MAKGRALARPSERSERFEPFVRPDWPDTVAAATQKEKADTAELEGERLVRLLETFFGKAKSLGKY